MGTKCIFSILISLITLVNSGPLEVVYTGEGCECPKRLGYCVSVPEVPPPLPYLPTDLGYKIYVPPVQAKAKVSYSFDFMVEEPKPPCPLLEPKLDLYTKVDRVTMPKQDCKCGAYKSPYRYVNGNWILNKCNCGSKKCKCNLRRRKTSLGTNSIKSATGTPILLESGALERNKYSTRRKRDLRRIFFRPIRQDLKRSARYVKHYHKNLSESTIDQQPGLFNFHLLSNANPFKRKTKKVFFPYTHAKIVKRDIKGEYDLLEKEREAADLTLPEIIQYMPETLQPDFKRGACQFGCGKSCLQTAHSRNSEEFFEKEVASKKFDQAATTDQTQNSNINESDDNLNDDDNSIDDNNNIDGPTFRKRNAALYGYQEAAVSQINQPASNAYTLPQNGYESSNGYEALNGYDAPKADYAAQNDYAPQNAYAAQMTQTLPSLSTQSSTNPIYDTSAAAPSPCEQRKMYAAMRRAAERPKHIYDHLGHEYIEDQDGLRLVSSYSSVPDPFAISGMPLKYAGDLEIPQLRYEYSKQPESANPILGTPPPQSPSPKYPVQHVSSAVLDRIITDIVYRHPDFIDASSHYGGALVDPEPYQEQQTKDFIKKLIDGRLSLVFSEPEDQYSMQYYPPPNYHHSGIHNPYNQPTSLAFLQTLY